jgi:hypothetical protein
MVMDGVILDFRCTRIPFEIKYPHGHPVFAARRGSMNTKSCVACSLFLLLLTSNGFCKDYFVSSKGNDDSPGTATSSPWKTLSKVNSTLFFPGDVVRFDCGSTWTGNLLIQNSGTQGNPIRFTSYGVGEKPVIRNTGIWSHSIDIRANYVIVENFLMKESHEAGVYILDNYSHNVVQDCEFANTGAGVVVRGSYNLVTRNYFHEGTMVVNTPGGSDDFGANGVVVNGPNNEISYNRGVNLIASSFDFGIDGGFVEFYGNVDNSYVHHNWVQYSAGFFEVGGGSARNVRISYNVSLNNRSLGSIHITDQFGSIVENFRVENNTIVDVAEYGSTSSALIWFGGAPSPSAFFFRNNIVMLGNFSFLSISSFSRSNNLYHFLNAATRIGGSGAGPGDIQADPKFIDPRLNNFHLRPESPAIDKGIDLGYTIDYDRQPVPVGGAPDLGAYEYNPNVKTPMSPSPPTSLRIQ